MFNGNVRGVYACEVWDLGDACGGTPSNPYKMGSMVFKYAINGPWIRNPVSIKACDRADPPYVCKVLTNESVEFYTPLR
jgi:hypothetical protein